MSIKYDALAAKFDLDYALKLRDELRQHDPNHELAHVIEGVVV